MKRSEAGKKLTLVLILALAPASPGLASGEKSLPLFKLDSVKISGLPEIPDGCISPVPPPTDTGYYFGAKKGGVRLDSSIAVFIDGQAGRAEINFPAAEHSEERSGFRSSLFIKFAEHSSAAVLSWATVVCSGRQYLGYKGSSLKFPDRSGDFIIKDETLSLGPAKTRLGMTHPWVIPAAQTDNFQGLRWCQVAGYCPPEDQSLDRLCTSDFPGRMKAYAVKALPAKAGGYSFKYDPAKNELTVSWTK
ncbi:MAG: hypothetical protein Q7R35_10455 [Elusimicrobiota bacterium]|nr:hypothetical protein [Elusimicrobiota bacterium]